MEFGNGQFLDWARDNDFNVCGIEQLKEFCAMAKSRGHNVYRGYVNTTLEQVDGYFNLIVLFDVCEHLTVQELVNLFSV